MTPTVHQVEDFLMDVCDADFRDVQYLGNGLYVAIATTEYDLNLLCQCIGISHVEPIRLLKSGAVQFRFQLNSPILGSTTKLPNYHVDLRTERHYWHWSVTFAATMDSTRIVVREDSAPSYEAATRAIQKTIMQHWKESAK